MLVTSQIYGYFGNRQNIIDCLDVTMASVREKLEANRESWLAEQAERRERREEWQEEIRRRKKLLYITS